MLLQRAKAWRDDPVERLRIWWEDVYGQPALGNPVFENVSAPEWVAHLTAKHLAGGGGVTLDAAKGFVFTDKPTSEEVDANRAFFTGDRDDDTVERRTVLGLDVDDDDEE